MKSSTAGTPALPGVIVCFQREINKAQIEAGKYSRCCSTNFRDCAVNVHGKDLVRTKILVKVGISAEDEGKLGTSCSVQQ